MKLPISLGWFTAALMLCSLSACKQEANESCPAPKTPALPAVPKVVSAEPSSFDAVAKHLDAGGGMYVFLSTEAFMKTASEKLAQIGPLALAAGKMDDAKKAQAEAAWKTLSKVAAKSGLDEVSGFGVSSIALEPGYYQTRWMLHHYPDKGNGLIWKTTTSTPNALDFVSYLPEHTAMASSGNLKLAPIWDALNQEAQTNADLKQGIDLATQQFQAMAGLNLPALISSLGPNFAMVVTLDETRQTPIPNGSDTPLTVPEPALALFIQVQDDVLINRLDQQFATMPMMVKADEGDLSMRVLNMPLPVAFVHPAVAWKKGLLMISTSDALIREMMEVKAGKKPGVASTAEFKKLMVGLPTTGCKFAYVSQLAQKTIKDFQLAQTKHDQSMNPAVKTLIETIYSYAQAGSAVGVTEETPEGWIGTTHQETNTPRK